MAFKRKGGGKKPSGKASGAKPAGAKRVAKVGGPNPFDVRSNAKAKYEVLGKRVKGAGRNVALARAAAEAKRRKTLGAEFQSRNKRNEFRDRRLGEQDPTLSLEDKMMARFQSERKRKLRNASAFNLQDSDQEGDEEDEELFLTHGGQKIDDYDRLNADAPLDDEDNDEEGRRLDREIVDRLHFGGGDGEKAEAQGGVKKTHKEVMHEVMMKAKLFKAERQQAKATQVDTTEALDDGFDDIRGLLEFRPTRASGKELPDKGPMDEFDKLTRELAFEAKAKATERRLSPEEAAKKEHDRLAELEKKRVARMNGEDADDSDEEGAGGKKSKGKKAKKTKAPQTIIMPPTDDDLAEGYEVDKRFGAAGEEDEDNEEEGDEDEEEEEDEDEDDGSEEEDSEAESDDEGDNAKAPVGDDDEAAEKMDDEEDDDSDDEEAVDKAEERAKQAADELPYVFPCPETPEELSELFKAHGRKSPATRSLIVERLLAYYSPRLSVENQHKMKTFFAILVRQFLRYAGRYAAHKEDLDHLTIHLFSLAQQLGNDAAVVTRELLANLFKRLHGSKAGRDSRRPQLAEVLLFKALARVFPTSDLRHNVVSPMETLLAESLVRGRLETPQDAVEALATCALLLDMARDKQRFAPEVVVALRRLVRAFLAGSSTDSAPNWLHRELATYRETHAADETLPSLDLAAASSASAEAVLSSLVALVDATSAQYAALPAFEELFRPLYLLLHEVARATFDGHQPQLNAAIASLHERLAASGRARRPLRLQTAAPSVLPTFAPKFDENYTVRKDKTRDKDSAQVKQLQRQVKRARKGAARELRRDAEFVARAQQQEENVRLEAKRAKQKEIWKWLEEQHATFNQQVKKGGNMLKGGGSGGPAKNRRTPRK